MARYPMAEATSLPLVALLDPIHPDGLALLRPLAALALVYETEATAEPIWPRVEGLIVRTSPVSAALLAHCPKLKAVGKHGTGIDNIDLAAASAAGIAVFNTPGANALAVAEGAVALMLAVIKRLRAGHDLVAGGRFAERGSWRAGDLSGRTLGLVGGGRIAAELARICGRGFGMRVLMHSPRATAARAAALGAELCPSLEAMLAAADIVSIHAPLTDETRGLMGPRAIARMKKGAVLINTARGGIVDEAALAEALAAGHLAGAGLDVFAEEPPDPGSLLLRLDNVVLSPHVAGITEDSARRMAVAVAAGMIEALAGRQPAALLNPAVWALRRP